MEALRLAGRIKLYEPRMAPHEAYRRRLWLHPIVEAWVQSTGETAEERDYHAKTRAFLKAFVIGSDFDDENFLKVLKPPEEAIFEFRVTFEPQVRILGGFICAGEFIATNYFLRKDAEFKVRRKRCREIWQSLFPKHPRLPHDRSTLLGDFEND